MLSKATHNRLARQRQIDSHHYDYEREQEIEEADHKKRLFQNHHLLKFVFQLFKNKILY